MREARRPGILRWLAPACCALLPLAACGQSGWSFVPTLTLAEVHDDNIFFAAQGAESDLITRITPSLDASYDASRLKLHGSYSFDSEIYADHDSLDSAQARQQGTASINYRADRRLTLSLSGGYTETHRPGELNLISGIEAGRVNAERFFINPSLSYRLGALTGAGLEYSLTRDILAGGVSGDVHEAGVDIDHRFNDRNDGFIGVTGNSYEFGNGASTTSILPRAGFTHDFSRQAEFSLKGGPRFTADGVRPELTAGFSYRTSRGEFGLHYTRAETILVGEAGTAESESLDGDLTWRFRPGAALNLSSGYGKANRGAEQATVFHARVNVSYRLNRILMFSASYRYSRQWEAGGGGPDLVIPGNVIMLGINLSCPSPSVQKTSR